MTNILQPLSCKVAKTISVACSDNLIILVLYKTLITRVCLFDIRETVA